VLNKMATAVKELNIIIAGVGGQGVVLLSDILGDASVRGGLKVRGSEVLGMAQRGGSVFSNIRVGSDVESPMTSEGKCHVLIALEPTEALRNIQYVSKDTTVIVNMNKVIPSTVSIGKSKYPELDAVIAKIKEVAGRVVTIDAVAMAEQAGSRQSINVVMLGTLFGTGKMPFTPEIAKEIIGEKFKPKVAEINYKAFDLGYDAVK